MATIRGMEKSIEVAVILLLCIVTCRGVTRSISESDAVSVLEAIQSKVQWSRATDGALGLEGTGCKCAGYSCGCCLFMDVPKVGLNDTVCANVSYLPDQYGVSLTMSLDGSVFYNETVSLKNPPPLCEDIKGLRKLASACVVFYDLSLSKSMFSGCMYVDIRLDYVLVKRFNIGCFHMPLQKHLTQVNIVGDVASADSQHSGMFPRYSSAGCGCKHPYYDCGCCVHVEIDVFKFDHSACGNVSFNPSTEELSALLSVDGRVYINQSISVRNPPALCLPFLGVKGVEVCARLYDLDIEGGKLIGCLNVSMIVEGRVYMHHVGCFMFPPNSERALNTGRDLLKMDLDQLMQMTFEEVGQKKIPEKL